MKVRVLIDGHWRSVHVDDHPEPYRYVADDGTSFTFEQVMVCDLKNLPKFTGKVVWDAERGWAS